MSLNKAVNSRKPQIESNVHLRTSLNDLLDGQGLDNKEKIQDYKALATTDHLSSRVYVLSQKYNLSIGEAETAIISFGSYNKALEFTDFFDKILLKYGINRKDYLEIVKKASKNDFSFVPKEMSLLEQEVINLQNKFNLNLMQTYHRDVPDSSVHYYEHIVSRTDRV